MERPCNAQGLFTPSKRPPYQSWHIYCEKKQHCYSTSYGVVLQNEQPYFSKGISIQEIATKSVIVYLHLVTVAIFPWGILGEGLTIYTQPALFLFFFVFFLSFFLSFVFFIFLCWCNVELSSRAPIPFFRPESVHSSSAS